MSPIATAASTDPETASAVAACMAQLETALDGAPTYLMVQTNAAYDIEVLRTAIATHWPDVQLHGATSCLGAMTQDGPVTGPDRGMAFWGMRDEGGDFGTALHLIGDAPFQAGASAVAAALAAADRVGEVPQLVWMSAAPGREEQVLAGIRSVVGDDVPIIGGSAADNAIAGAWRQFTTQQVAVDGIVVSVLFTSLILGSAFHSGYAPTGEQAVVTAATGRTVLELDGRPAADVYRQWSGVEMVPEDGAEAVNVLGATTLAPLGRPVGSLAGLTIYVLSHPETIRADGGVSLFTDIDVGETVELMTGTVEGLIRRPGRVCDSAMEMGELSPRRIKGGILVYCAGCMLTVGDRIADVHAALAEQLPGVPFIAAFTFGEQGPVLEQNNRHGNLMISAVLFGD